MQNTLSPAERVTGSERVNKLSHEKMRLQNERKATKKGEMYHTWSKTCNVLKTTLCLWLNFAIDTYFTPVDTNLKGVNVLKTFFLHYMWRSTGKRCFPENPETFLGYLRESCGKVVGKLRESCGKVAGKLREIWRVLAGKSCGELWEVPGFRKWKEIRIWLFWLIVKEFLYFMFGFVSFS